MSGIEGVECWLHREVLNDDGQGHIDYAETIEPHPCEDSCSPYTAFPEPVAAALVAVAEAARVVRSERTPGPISVNEGIVFAALEALAEAQAGAA